MPKHWNNSLKCKEKSIAKIMDYAWLKNNQIMWQHTETAKIIMRELNKQEIEIYLNKDMPLQSCGSYQLENNAKHLFYQCKRNR